MTTTSDGPIVVNPAAIHILRLFQRIKSLGTWSAPDVADLTAEWFTEIGFDIVAPAHQQPPTALTEGPVPLGPLASLLLPREIESLIHSAVGALVDNALADETISETQMEDARHAQALLAQLDDMDDECGEDQEGCAALADTDDKTDGKDAQLTVPRWEPAFVGIDGLHAGPWPALILADETHNGSPKPRFEPHTLTRIVTELAAAGTDITLRWTGPHSQAAEIRMTARDDTARTETETVHPDSDGLYPLGSRAWTWLGAPVPGHTDGPAVVGYRYRLSWTTRQEHSLILDADRVAALVAVEPRRLINATSDQIDRHLSILPDELEDLEGSGTVDGHDRSEVDIEPLCCWVSGDEGCDHCRFGTSAFCARHQPSSSLD